MPQPPPAPATSPATSGGDENGVRRGPALALRALDDGVPAPSRFEPVDPDRAAGATRARGWAGLEDRRRGEQARTSLGNWLCRIWTHYGPPPLVRPDGFVYAFRDRETDDVLTAYGDEGGPAMGGRIVGEDGLPIAGAPERLAASVEAFVALMDATTPRDCALEITTARGPRRVGVRGGAWFEEPVE